MSVVKLGEEWESLAEAYVDKRKAYHGILGKVELQLK